VKCLSQFFVRHLRPNHLYTFDEATLEPLGDRVWVVNKSSAAKLRPSDYRRGGLNEPKCCIGLHEANSTTVLRGLVTPCKFLLYVIARTRMCSVYCCGENISLETGRASMHVLII